MAPSLLVDLSSMDLDRVLWDADKIESINPHRYPFRMLDAVVWLADDFMEAVAYKEILADDWWVPGHLPGRPLFPGVLMLEAGAQLASLMSLNIVEDQKFLGFAGLENVKFRSQVVPGDRLYILGKGVQFKRRRSLCDVQGVVNGNLVFEARISGMAF